MIGRVAHPLGHLFGGPGRGDPESLLHFLALQQFGHPGDLLDRQVRAAQADKIDLTGRGVVERAYRPFDIRLADVNRYPPALRINWLQG